MSRLAPLLPQKYSPLRPNGAGLQNVYLTAVPETLAAALVDLIGAEANILMRGYYAAEEVGVIPAIGLEQWEEHQLNVVRDNVSIPETEREQVVIARRGQGLFKSRVMQVERSCRITGATREEHLRASHCKPWRDSTNEERLDGENGLLLTPNADHLFDRGFIGFENGGDLIISPVADPDSLARLGLDMKRRVNVGQFSAGQRKFLDFHRDFVLLKSSFF